jgi:hypothetical protein
MEDSFFVLVAGVGSISLWVEGGTQTGIGIFPVFIFIIGEECWKTKCDLQEKVCHNI